MDVQIVGVFSLILSIFFLVLSAIFKRQNRAKIIRERKKEEMEVDVPGFLSLLSDQLYESNMTTTIKTILESPVAFNNKIVKEIKNIYVRLFRSGRVKELNDITDVVKYATVKKYPTSPLLGLLYTKVKLGNELDKEIVEVINSIEELSYNIVNFIINIKRTMSSTVNTMNTITLYLVPLINSISPVIYAILQKQINNISQSMGVVSGFSGAGSVVGLKPLQLPPSYFAFILTFEIIVMSYLTTKIKYQMTSISSTYNVKADALSSIGKSLLLYAIAMMIFSKMFSGLI